MALMPVELCFATRASPATGTVSRRRATVRCAATAPAPMGKKTEYRDGPLERAFMGLFARKMEKYAGRKKKPGGEEEKKAVWDWDYESFVDVSRRVMVGRSRAQQQEAVREVLLSMLPPGAPEQFKKLFPPTRWACEFNAALTVPFFHWLVGPSEVVEVEVDGVKQRSGVLIKKCRYLENSGCVGMCVNMCKIPTQSFFTDEFGCRRRQPQQLVSEPSRMSSCGGAWRCSLGGGGAAEVWLHVRAGSINGVCRRISGVCRRRRSCGVCRRRAAPTRRRRRSRRDGRCGVRVESGGRDVGRGDDDDGSSGINSGKGERTAS